MPAFHDLGNATLNCANSSASLSKSKTTMSGLPDVVSTLTNTAHGLLTVGFIEPAGIHIDSLPATLVSTPACVTAPANALVLDPSIVVAIFFP